MRTRKSSRSAEASEQIQTAGVDALIIYEDCETGTRARGLVHRVLQSLGADREFNVAMWKFELLDVPSLGMQAAQEATASRIVWFATHGTGDLPVQIQGWMNRWKDARRGNHRAFVISLDGDEYSTMDRHTVLMDLYDTAKDARMAFFYLFSDVPRPQLDSKLNQITTWVRRTTERST